MKMWKEKLARQNTGISVSTLVNHNILEKHRYYIKSIAEIIQFLAINELVLRGTYEAEEHAERSLFSNLFKFTLKKIHCFLNVHSIYRKIRITHRQQSKMKLLKFCQTWCGSLLLKTSETLMCRGLH
jgi:hypothetical protein